MKIVSGGQTGVDRAALDVALKYGVECGGWCPEGRLDEVGKIPDRYPLKELPGGSFDDRTRANVRDSDGSVMVYFRELTGGTKYAVDYCGDLGKPCLLIDAAVRSAEEAATLIRDFVSGHHIDVVGIGGPRASGWPNGYDYAYRVMEIFVNSIFL